MSDKFNLSDAKNLIDDLEKGEKFYRAYKEAGVVAARVAGLLQAEQEAELRVKVAQADEFKILESMEAALAQKDQEFAGSCERVKKAEQEAKTILANANNAAGDIVFKAKEAAEAVKASYASDIEDLKGKLEAEKDNLVELLAKTSRAQNEFDKITTAVLQAKAKMKELIG